MELISSLGLSLADKAGRSVPPGELSGKVVAFYFSAHWCPPCRQFTPVLKRFYEEAKRNGEALEIIFASMDKSEDEGKAYFREHHGDWLMLNFSQTAQLNQQYTVRGIPSLLVVDPKGKTIVPNAREDVQSATLKKLNVSGAAAAVQNWRRLGAGPDWRESAGATLGGAAAPLEGAAALRAARLARFGGAGAASAASAAPSAAAATPAAAASSQGAASAAPSAAAAAPAAAASSQGPSDDRTATPAAAGSTSAAASAPPMPPPASYAGLAELPESAVLRILAQSDLPSGYALATSGGFARVTAEVAFAALREVVEKARQEHSEATAAIEAERAAGLTQVTAQQETFAAALAALEPLRNSRTRDRFPQLAEVFATLEVASGPTAEQSAEAEAALAARAAAAAAAMQAQIASAHSRVAEGELDAARLGVA